MAFPALIAVVAALGQVPGLRAVDPDDCILTDTKAFMALPPRPAGNGQTIWMQWSPSGRYLLMAESRPQLTPTLLDRALQGGPPPPPTIESLVWDRQTGRTSSPERLPESYYPQNLEFFAGTDVGVASYHVSGSDTRSSEEEPIQSMLLIVDPAANRQSRIPNGTTAPGFTPTVSLLASPSIPRVLVVLTEIPPFNSQESPGLQMRTSAWTVDRLGRPSPRIDLGNTRYAGAIVRQGGEVAELFVYRLGQNARPARESLFIDFRDGRRIAGFEHRETPVSEPPFEVLRKPASSSGRSFHSAWLKSRVESESPETILAGRADEALLAPTNDAVALRDQGVVTVRLLAAIPKEAFLQARAAADRMKAMAYGKQVAVGLLLFAADHGDRLPSASEFGDGAIGQYLKDKGLGGGFVYMMSGGFLGDIKNPAEAVVGFVPGPGGYAWVHADGHVVWKTDPPKPPQPNAD